MNTHIQLSHVSLAVLGLIAEGKSYPYQLKKKIEKSEMHNWTKIGQSSIYGVLNRLEEEKLITSRITTSEQNRTLKILNITKKGFQVLKEHVINILSTAKHLDRDWDLAFSNSKFLSEKEKIGVFEKSIESLRAHKKVLEDKLRKGSKIFRDRAPIHYRGLFLRAIKVIGANIEFCKEILLELKQ